MATYSNVNLKAFLHLTSLEFAAKNPGFSPGRVPVMFSGSSAGYIEEKEPKKKRCQHQADSVA
jgi:hypothetical protein